MLHMKSPNLKKSWSVTHTRACGRMAMKQPQGSLVLGQGSPILRCPLDVNTGSELSVQHTRTESVFLESDKEGWLGPETTVGTVEDPCR